MNTNQKGFASILLIIALVIILAGGLGYFALTQKPTAQMSQTSPKMQIELLSLTSQNKNVLPVIRYRIDGNVQGNGYIQLVSKNSGESIWSMEQEPSGTHDLDLNTLTRLGDYSAIKIPEGDYFLRATDKFDDNAPSDTLVACTESDCSADSVVFHIALGVTQIFTSSQQTRE